MPPGTSFPTVSSRVDAPGRSPARFESTSPTMPAPQVPRARPESGPSAGTEGGRCGRAERDQLVLDHLQLARRVAARFRGRGPDFDDLVQVASVALIGAATRYDPGRGCDFASFAIPTITGEIKRYFRDHTWAVRVPRRLQELHLRLRDAATVLDQQLGRAPTPSEIAAHLAIPIDDVRVGLEASWAYAAVSLDAPRPATDSSPGQPPVTDLPGRDLPDTGRDEFAAIDWQQALIPALRQLSERGRQIVYLRFVKELTQDKIGERVGLSQMQVSRILTRTLTELRVRLCD